VKAFAVRKNTQRRFGANEVTKGKFTGGLHVATKAYVGELTYLALYLNHRLMPQDPEEVHATVIMLNLQNILEYELELVIASYVNANKTANNQSFLDKSNAGFVSFKAKFEWALAKNLVAEDDVNVMEQVRSIRNDQIHARPSKGTKHKYFGKQLLTLETIRKLFTDMNRLVLKLRSISGNKEKWPVIPPGYAEEMGWHGKPKKAGAVRPDP
jgi:hypothetical protein